MAYSQSTEEEHILKELDSQGVKNGRFLDIGAWDGKGFSNTYRLAELGWRGVCVEPSSFVFPKLLENYASMMEGMEFVNAAIAPIKSSLIPWYESGGDAIGTTSEAHVKKWTAGWPGVKFRRVWIYVLPLDTLLDTFGTDFNMINIDVESTNIELFRALPIQRFNKLKIICIEHDGYIHEMTERARAYGFAPIHTNGENLIFARR